MATAGKAVAFSALTVLASLAAILLVPSPAFRSMALGIMLAVVAVLAATLTLLPAVLGRLGTRIDAGRIRLAAARPAATPTVSWLEQRLHAWGRCLWRHPLPAAAGGLAVLGLAAAPVIGLRTCMPSITIIPASANARVGYNQVTAAFGPGAPGTLQVLVPAAGQPAALATLAHTPGVAGGRARARPATAGRSTRSCRPPGRPPPATGATIDRIRHVLPAGSLVGGAAAENHDLQHALSSRGPRWCSAILAARASCCCSSPLGAPLLAAAGVAHHRRCRSPPRSASPGSSSKTATSPGCSTSPRKASSTPGGRCSSGPWSSASPWTTRCSSSPPPRNATRPTADPEHAMIGSVGTSGRVVISAAAVMIAVFLTFALSGPLAPKEMGVILAVAVALDALLVRLVLLPVLLRLGGHHAWHQPRWLARVIPHVRLLPLTFQEPWRSRPGCAAADGDIDRAGPDEHAKDAAVGLAHPYGVDLERAELCLRVCRVGRDHGKAKLGSRVELDLTEEGPCVSSRP